MITKKSVHFSEVPNEIKYYKEHPIYIDISGNCNYNSLKDNYRPPSSDYKVAPAPIVQQQQIVQQPSIVRQQHHHQHIPQMQNPLYYPLHPMSTPINIPINIEKVPLITTFTFFYPTKLQCNVIDVRIIIHENIIRIALHYNHRYVHHFDYRHRNGIIYNRNIT
jgi:hypothetical protein